MAPGKTHNEASREIQDIEAHQSFPMGSVDITVGQNSQSRESQPLAPVQEIL